MRPGFLSELFPPGIKTYPCERTLTAMAEKAAADIVDASHNEEVLPASKAEGGLRRDSIALNIVENPLEVSFAEPIPHAMASIYWY